MRTIALAASGALMLLSPAAAPAADLPAAYRPPVVVACTPEAPCVAAVAVPVARPLPLEPSRFTGQPLTVVYNDPGLLPGSVDPGLTLVPLPRVPRFHTRAVYPRGY